MGPRGAGSGRVGPSRVGRGWACIGIQLFTLRLRRIGRVGPVPAEWGRVGPVRAEWVGHALGFN